MHGPTGLDGVQADRNSGQSGGAMTPRITSPQEHPGGSSSEMLTVYSIVNTLVFNIDGIKKVQILIEGQTIDTIAGHMDCRQPFASNIKIIK